MSDELSNQDQISKWRRGIRSIKFNSWLIWRSLRDPHTPLLTKLLYPFATFGAWLFYLVLPEALIVLVVPIIGPFIAPFLSTPAEDLVIAPFVAAYAVGLLFLELIPEEVVRRHRERLSNPPVEPRPITNPSRLLITDDRVGERIERAYQRSHARAERVMREKERDQRSQRRNRP